MEIAVQKLLADPRTANDFVSRSTALPAFTIQDTNLVKNEVEMNSLERAEMERYRNSPEMQLQAKNVEDDIPSQKVDSIRSHSHLTDILDEKEMNAKDYSISTTYNELITSRYQACGRDRRSRKHPCRRHQRYSTPPAYN